MLQLKKLSPGKTIHPRTQQERNEIVAKSVVAKHAEGSIVLAQGRYHYPKKATK